MSINEQEYWVQRSLYIGDVLYTVSDRMVKMNSLEDLSPIGEVALSWTLHFFLIFTEPFPANIFNHNGHFLENASNVAAEGSQIIFPIQDLPYLSSNQRSKKKKLGFSDNWIKEKRGICGRHRQLIRLVYEGFDYDWPAPVFHFLPWQRARL